MIAAAPSDDVGFVLQMAGLGTLVGTGFAVRRRRRNPDADTWLPAAWGALGGAAAGVVWVLLGAVGL